MKIWKSLSRKQMTQAAYRAFLFWSILNSLKYENLKIYDLGHFIILILMLGKRFVEKTIRIGNSLQNTF